VPDLQIVLAEPSPLPGERPRRPLDQIAEAVGSDPSVHVLPGELGLGATELNALQRSVAVALQMAVPCGFSSGVFDAQWKGKPAVVGRAGQLLEQVGYGDDGFVVDGAPDAADAVVRLLRDPCLARGVGQRGRARVMRRHTITRLAAESLQMLQQVLAGVPQLGGAA
jgi:glycosyltransferase involved in cell wall biosynthesis